MLFLIMILMLVGCHQGLRVSNIRCNYGGHKTSFLLFGHPYNYLFDGTLCLLYNYVTFLYKRMTSSTSRNMDRYTTTEYGKQNMFASEPPMQYVEDYQGYGPHAEQLNGRLAMIGFFALVHNYILFGAVIAGIF